MVGSPAMILSFVLINLSRAFIEPYYSTEAPYKTRHQHMLQLFDRLLGPNSSYNRNVMPESDDPNRPFTVFCRLFLIRIQEILENEETLVSTMRLQLSWNDSSLQWNPDDYGGIKEILIPPEMIWAPDLQIANSIDNIIDITHNEAFMFRVTHLGRVWYHLSGKFQTRCRLHLAYYPFDYQVCPVIVEPVSHMATEMVVQMRPDRPDHPISLGMYSPNPTWSLLKTGGFSAIYATGRRTGFGRAQFFIIVSRKPNYYVRTIVIPLCLLSILQALAYLMPMKFVDRTGHATVVLLTAFLFQSQLSEQLPRTSDDESFVQNYLNILMGISVMTVFNTMLTLELIDPDFDLPFWGLFKLRSLLRSRNTVADSSNSHKVDILSACQSFEYIDASTIEGITSPVNVRMRQQHRPSLSRIKASPRALIIAAFVNWVGFVVSVAVALVYPLFAVAGYLYNKAPESPTANDFTESYYAEY